MSVTSVPTSGPRPRTAWRDRVRVLADASGVDTARLAALVDTERSRHEETLFTVTPTEELDELSRWQRLADAAWCGQVRTLIAASVRMSAAQREFLPCEMALALNMSDGSAQDLLALANEVASLPGLLEAVESGMLTVRHAYAALGALRGTGLGADERIAVITVALVRYQGQTPAQLGQLIRRLLLQVDAAAAAAREADATVRRQVRFRAIEDGQGLLVARGPLAMIEAIRASLEATLPLTVEDGDERSRDAREFDLLTDLLTGGWDHPGGGQDAPAGGWQPSIVVPFSVAAGGDLELAEIPGLGPVLPATARDLLSGCATVTRICVDGDGNVLAVDPLHPGPAAATGSETEADPDRWLRELSTPPTRIGIPASAGYTPTPRLRRYLEARDRTCTFPGCTRPASRTDKDHRIPWPLGLTDPENMHCLCRRHHRAKQTIFTVLKLPDGTTRWVTRGGWWFDRPPQRW